VRGPGHRLRAQRRNAPGAGVPERLLGAELTLGLGDGPPLFLAVFALDGSTTVAMLVFGIRARRALRGAKDPWWLEVVLLDVERLRQVLALARQQGLVSREVTPRQVFAGIVRM
jgi:hypothetical protein